jgi:phage shock protein PspC (stress-responsive transcriptional regulator)
MIAGVAGGVAEHLDADPSIIRIVWAVLIFLTGGLALLVYIVMAIVVPERPAGMDPIVATGEPAANESPAPANAEPVPAGSWRGPDGSTVPMASSATPRSRRRRDPADRARAGLIGGLILVGLGGIFLVRELIPAFDFDLWWPTMLIGLGILLIVLAVMPSRRSN